jgi:hypothetical protein
MSPTYRTSFAATTVLLEQAGSGDIPWDAPIKALWNLKLAAADLDAQKRCPLLVDQIQWAERAARKRDAERAVYHLAFAARSGF